MERIIKRAESCNECPFNNATGCNMKCSLNNNEQPAVRRIIRKPSNEPIYGKMSPDKADEYKKSLNNF